jgi:ribosomal protein S1
MSVEALRDFVQTLDAEGISDKTTVVCHHVNQSKRPVTLSVKEATTEESREPDGDPQPEVEAAPDGGDV